MKKVLLVLTVMVVAVSLMALPSVKSKLPENAPLHAGKAIKGLKAPDGFVYIGDVGNMWGMAPSKMSNIVVSEDGQTIQVIYATYDETAGGFTGCRYRVSTDGGATWADPVLISSSGPFARGYAEITTDSYDYPYVIMNYRAPDNSYFGIWFVTDLNGPGGGSWTDPYMVSDTSQNYAYMPAIDVTTDGANLITGAYDFAYGEGWATSNDYGTSWSTYTGLIDDILADIWDVDQISFRYVNDAYAVAVMDLCPDSDLVRPGIIDGYAAQVPYYKVYDMSTGTWSATEFVIPDTLPQGYLADNEWVVDEAGDSVHTSAGTWWYWWDLETNGNYAYFAMALSRGSWLVYDDTHKWYWNGANQIFFFQKDIVNGGDWTYMPITWIDSIALDTLGTTATWVGNCFSSNISFDQYGNIYVTYVDYPDTVYGDGLPMISWYDANAGEWYYYDGTKENANWADYTLTPYFDYVVDDSTGDTTAVGYYIVEAAKRAYKNDDGTVTLDLLLLPSDESAAYYYRATWLPPRNVDNNRRVSTFTLSQNMPNPVRDMTTIEYSVENSGHVTLNVYDLTGRVVKTLVNSDVAAGTHKVVWDRTDNNGNKVAQGVYFYRLTTNDGSLSKKMMVIE